MVHRESDDSTEQSFTESISEEKKGASSSERMDSSMDTPASEMGNDPKFTLMIEASQSQIPVMKEQCSGFCSRNSHFYFLVPYQMM